MSINRSFSSLFVPPECEIIVLPKGKVIQKENAPEMTLKWGLK